MTRKRLRKRECLKRWQRFWWQPNVSVSLSQARGIPIVVHPRLPSVSSPHKLDNIRLFVPPNCLINFFVQIFPLAARFSDKPLVLGS